MNGMPSFSLNLPADFADFEWELEAKGWFEASITALGRKYRLHFYDPTRLQQTVEDELPARGMFFEPNVVIVTLVNKANMERAVQSLIEAGLLSKIGRAHV